MSSVIVSLGKDLHIYPVTEYSRLEQPFRDVFAECFGEEPYEEPRDDERVIRDVYNKHLDVHGQILVALYKSELVGLACAERIIDDSESSPYLWLHERRDHLPFELDDACYISELAVTKRKRREGVGSLLLEELCEWAKGKGLTYYVARTAAKGSHSLGIFKNALHAKILEEKQNVEGNNKEIESKSKERLWVWGRLEDL